MVGTGLRTVAFAILLSCPSRCNRGIQDNQTSGRRPASARAIRLLFLSLSLVAVVLPGHRGTRPQRRRTVRHRKALLVRGAWALAAIRARLPANCEVPAPRLNRELMTSMLDLMPAPRLGVS